MSASENPRSQLKVNYPLAISVNRKVIFADVRWASPIHFYGLYYLTVFLNEQETKPKCKDLSQFTHSFSVYFQV